MNLRSMDLNLLLIFDAIYSERSISRAALRLNLSQPAVSNALARLRHALEDPLFKREGSGMVPTARAKSLRDPISQALELLERGFRSDETFDHSQSSREFVIAVEDYGETVLIPRFIDWLAEAAPGIHIQIRPELSSSLTRELREGTVDLALDYFALRGDGFESRCVLTEDLVTLSRIDHPAIGEQLSLETYLALQHAVITPRRKSRPMIDLALDKRGLKRKIALTVPHFLSMPTVVQRSNLLATLPRRMAYIYADHFRLKTYTPPVRTPKFPVFLIWHDTFKTDPAHRWLRNHLIALCESL
ncbi:LysR family transcriptional regulator [Martelella lutilitoris]|uniref:LysR family transcriptional regulator n=1 Tax=Martelella lutilitoris TaxID=2583532 RepID=A0A5C4JQN3_9HYPH|nr:LysR family transcriptional regulator [Martelella lutilitoris]TNB47726.1 LysR family transcriptional regulator [Martelella lutilitoris]